MKAVTIHAHGGAEVLQYENAPDPIVKAPDDVVVAIRAASLNAADVQVRSGRYAGPRVTLPRIPGRDFSGVVLEAGSGSDILPGEEVYGVCPHTGEGSHAERIAISSRLLGRKPPELSHAQAAAIGLAGLTAMVALQDTLNLRVGERIFIQGGAGGVGSMALQLARHLGAFVATTAREVNHEYVKSLGANLAIDYTKDDPVRVIRDFDAALDAVGGDRSVAQTFGVLKPGGRAAFIGSGMVAPASPRADLVSLRPLVARSGESMDRISALVRSGALVAPPIIEMPLSEARKAHELSESGKMRGKLVLVP